MSTKIALTLATVLVLSSAPAALAAHNRTAPGWSDSRSGGFVPGSAAEERWFDHASSPSNL